jgi:hypothetical protein
MIATQRAEKNRAPGHITPVEKVDADVGLGVTIVRSLFKKRHLRCDLRAMA